MKYRYQATERFWTSFYRLGPEQKESARKAWQIFKEDPFDPRLRAHKNHRVSTHYGRVIYAIVLEGDLRSLFYVEGDLVVSLVLGTHDIYKS